MIVRTIGTRRYWTPEEKMERPTAPNGFRDRKLSLILLHSRLY
jgi:hypothetical protein